MGFHLSVCAEMIWLDQPMAVRAARLKERGFGVGLWDVMAHDLDALQATGARFSIMNGFSQGGLTDPDGAGRLLDSAAHLARVGKRLGVERLNILGRALDEVDQSGPAQPVLTPAMWETARDTLLRLVDLAERLDVTFALENLNTRVDHPGVPFARATETLALVAQVDHPRLRLNLDLYHAQIGEGNLIQLCQRCLPWIGEIQVADVPGRHQPGTGEVHWPNLAKALAGMGYQGPVTLEAWPLGAVDAALESFRAAFTV